MIGKFSILYPSIVMAVLTVVMILALGARRLAAVRKRAVALRYYRTYDQVEGETGSLRQHARHVQNHFEVPPLFHLGVLATFAAGEVTPLAVGVAWFFVASRCVHSVIHLTYNNVTHRFLVYGAGLLALLFLWLRLLMTLAG